jgi:hypothetical protein
LPISKGGAPASGERQYVIGVEGFRESHFALGAAAAADEC